MDGKDPYRPHRNLWTWRSEPCAEKVFFKLYTSSIGPERSLRTGFIAVCARKGRKYAEEFMANNVVLVPVMEDMNNGMPAFLQFLEKWRGIPGKVHLICTKRRSIFE